VASWQQPVARTAILACLCALLAGCGGGEAPPPAARPWRDPGYVEAGGVRLHYALTATVDLPAEIAGSYGIDQRRNLALLTITCSPGLGAGGARSEPASLSATALTLTGRRLPLALERRDSATGATWLATVEFRDREPITIEIEASSASAAALTARFTRTLAVD